MFKKSPCIYYINVINRGPCMPLIGFPHIQADPAAAFEVLSRPQSETARNWTETRR